MPDDQGHKGIGRGMTFAAWIGLLVVLTLFFQDQLHFLENPNQSPKTQLNEEAGFREVVLNRNAQGHYVVTGKINGRTVQMLVDTGATDVALSWDIAASLDLDLREGGFSKTANGTVAVWRTLLQNVSIGGIELNDVRAVVLPKGAMSEQVLLGMSFLKKLELVQKDGQLTLRQYPG